MRSMSPILVLLLLGCSTASQPDRVRVLGEIAGYHDDDPHIEVVPAAGSARVTITTYGGGCHTKGETEVQVRGREAVVTPYDYTAPPDTPCTRQLVAMTHETTVRFEGSGPVRILVRGIDTGGRSGVNPVGDTITVERTVEIP